LVNLRNTLHLTASLAKYALFYKVELNYSISLNDFLWCLLGWSLAIENRRSSSNCIVSIILRL